MKQRKGYMFEDEIRRSILHLKETNKIPGKLWLWKIVDTHSYRGLKSLIGDENDYLIPKVPSDFLVLYDGKPIFLEAKMTSRKPSYDLTWIKDHQIHSGLQIMDQGIPYYFLINKRWRDPTKRNQDYKIYIVNAKTIAKEKERLQKMNKRSIKWDDLEKISDTVITSEQRKHGLWDLSWLFYEGLQ